MTFEAVALDAYGNVATSDNESVNVTVTKEGSDSCDGCFDLLGANLENGRYTFDIHVAVRSTRVQVSMEPHQDGKSSLSSIVLFQGAPPDLDAVKLNWDPRTANSDGSYNGYLEVKDPTTSQIVNIDPNSLIVSGDFTVHPNGTTTVPLTGITLSGDDYSLSITVTTPTDPATGELQTASYTEGAPIQVMGCVDAQETIRCLGRLGTAAGRGRSAALPEYNVRPRNGRQ